MVQVEELTRQFYDWEMRCRGRHAFPMAVELEPTFYPFFGHYAEPKQYIDDGRKPGIFEEIGSFFRKLISTEEGRAAREVDEDILPIPFEEDEGGLRAFKVVLPKGEKIGLFLTEELFTMLSSFSYPVSFEIVATEKDISVQFVCRSLNAVYLRHELLAYFPTARIIDVSHAVFDILTDQIPGGAMVEYALAEEFTRPLRMLKSLDFDSHTGLYGILESLSNGERGCIQVLFQGAVNPWAESIMAAVTDSNGDSFFYDAPEMRDLGKEKVSAPLFAVVVRSVAQAATDERALMIAQLLGQIVGKLSKSEWNSLSPLLEGGYPTEEMVRDIYLRQSHRNGMLLNAKELANLAHLPGASINSRKLHGSNRKSKAAPLITEGHRYVLGTNVHEGMEKEATLGPAVRLKHTHVIGATGTGKSTFLLSSIANDIRNGEGIAVLDPHGDLIDGILSWIPPERAKDVVYVDPADAEFPVGFNILLAHSDLEKEILSSDLVAVFRRQSTSWGDQMNSIFANAILAFLESSEGGTLLDLRRFLVEKQFRDRFLRTVPDANVRYYWDKEFPMLRGNSVAPILTRLDTFLRPKLIRNMVAQRKGLDFEDFLDTKKIVLVKLSQGLIGAENSYLLGTFIVSKLQQAAMSRQAKAKADRGDFYLYIDEFQNFITQSMSQILSGARKYHLGLILAHQDMQQVSKYDAELANSVLSNAGTRVCFRIGDTDARRFAEGFSFFDSQDLQNLETGEAICRVERADYDFNILVNALPEQDNDEAILAARESCIAHSRNEYATHRNEVEALFQVEHVEEAREAPKAPFQTPKQEIQYPEIIKPSDLPKEALPQARKQVERREESQHRYLQMLIKRMAESRGYRASIEEPTPDGKGRVDVALFRNDRRIACEIGMTTTDIWEVHNVEKCLAAGYDPVIICSNDRKNLEKVHSKVKELLATELQEKVLALEPEALFLYLDQLNAKEASSEVRVKGYRVKVDYRVEENNVTERKKEGIIKAVRNTKSINAKE
jgi:hypothetical protein